MSGILPVLHDLSSPVPPMIHGTRTAFLGIARRKHYRGFLRSLGMPCAICGARCGRKANLDHLIPVSRGGVSSESNMVLVCVNCNRMKADRTFTELRRDLLRAARAFRLRHRRQLAVA